MTAGGRVRRQATGDGEGVQNPAERECPAEEDKENVRLKKMVAKQALDVEILKEAAKGNW